MLDEPKMLLGAALFLAAWALGFHAGSRSSKSTLTASKSVMKAAQATSAMASRTAEMASAATGLDQTGLNLLAEMETTRRAVETLIEMVKAELMAEVMQSRKHRVSANPLSERVTMPTIPHDGAPLWGRSTSLESPTPSESPIELDRPT